MALTGTERMRRMRERKRILDTLGYGNTAPEPHDPDKIIDGRDDAKWVAECVRKLEMLAASIGDYYGRRQWTPAGKRERENRGEVGFTG